MDMITKENHSISLKMKLINDKIRQIGDETFAKYDLTGPQVIYLSYILGAGGSMPQHELERKAGVSHPTIVGVAGRMQNKGYVRIRTDEKDRRKRIIELTEKAEKVTCRLRKNYEELNSSLLDGMTDEEKEELNRLLDNINKNLCMLLEEREDAKHEKK